MRRGGCDEDENEDDSEIQNYEFNYTFDTMLVSLFVAHSSTLLYQQICPISAVKMITIYNPPTPTIPVRGRYSRRSLRVMLMKSNLTRVLYGRFKMSTVSSGLLDDGWNEDFCQLLKYLP